MVASRDGLPISLNRPYGHVEMIQSIENVLIADDAGS
jgi:hypothetical protein